MSDTLKQTANVEGPVARPPSEFAPLIDELYREEVLEARRMPLEEKLIAGERLFRWACAITLEGIRFQNPDATEEDRQRMLRERLELGRLLEASA